MAHTLLDVPRLASTADGRWEIGRGVAYRLWPLLRPMATGWRKRALGRTRLVTVVGSLGKTTAVRCIAAALGEIARVLRPGGQLLLTLDNPRNPLLALRNLVPHRLRLLARMTPYYVGYTHDPEALGRALDAVGFEVRETRAVLHFPRALVGLWGALSRETGLTGLDQPLLRALGRAERLTTWRTRWLTGQYIAVRAVRRSG